MGSKARQQAIANGKIVENAEAVRRRRRREASIMREELAIELYAKGKTSTQISEAMFEAFGVKLTGNIPELVRRGLYRRMQANTPNVEAAKELFEIMYRKLVEAYMPRALGEVLDPETGMNSPPDLRAAEFALRVMDKWGVVRGAISPPRQGDVNLYLHQAAPPDAETQRSRVMDALQQERAKQMEIEGALAGTPAADDGPIDVYDGMILPPIPDGPTQER